MKTCIVMGTIIMSLVYFLISGILVMGGIMDSKYTFTDCYNPKRYEYIFPAYRLGCWLGEPK